MFRLKPVEAIRPAAPTRRVVLAGGGAAIVSACSRGVKADGVSLWAMSDVGENVPVVLAPFTQATAVPVSVQAIPFTAAHEKVLTAYAGRSLPDLLMVRDEWLPELVEIGAVAPVPGGAAALAGDYPAARPLVSVAGRAFARPWSVGTQVQFYRRDLLAAAGFAAPPAQRGAWTAMLRELKRRNPGGFALLMLLDWPEHLMTFAAQEGAVPLRDRDSRGNFSSPAFRAALGYYKSLFDEGLAPRVTLADISDTTTAFARGLFAVMPSAPFTIGDLRKRTAELPLDRWTVARLSGPDGPSRAPVVGYSLAVTTQARDPAQAWSVARYLTGGPASAELFRLTGELPSAQAAWSLPPVAGDRIARVFADQITAPAFAPRVLEWPRVETEMQSVAERVARGDLGVDEATAEMDRRADRLLAKRRWLLNKGLVA